MKEIGKKIETPEIQPEDKKQKGFTLVELVAVIVVLGILSAVALPKFMGIQGEARASAVEGARGNLGSAALTAHAKMLASNNMVVNLGDYTTSMSDWVAHYPKPTIAGHIAGLNFISGHDGHTTNDAMPGWQYFVAGSSLPTNSINGTAVVVASNQGAWSPASAQQGNQNGCYVLYTEGVLATVGSEQVITEPEIITVTTGCKASGM